MTGANVAFRMRSDSFVAEIDNPLTANPSDPAARSTQIFFTAYSSDRQYPK
jgi:hypothetical protein